jgi:hypothetical protein
MNGPRTLIGIDDKALYYLSYGDPAAGILAMPKSGGDGHTVVSDAQPIIGPYFDDTSLYWVDQADGAAVRRAPKVGGPTEILWSASGRWIQELTVDDCNVYWVADDPFEVFYRAK